jgi:hypothetical protein
LLSAEPASAQWYGAAAWSVAGSTGVVDESSTSIVMFDNTAGVAFRATAPAGSVATIRYPVSSLPWGTIWRPGDITHIYPNSRLRLSMTFRKPDDNSYAAATLKRVRVSDGVVSSLASVNSFGYFPSPDVQLSERTISCGEDACVSPSEYAYYIELVLWKPEIANDPRVVALRVHAYY